MFGHEGPDVIVPPHAENAVEGKVFVRKFLVDLIFCKSLVDFAKNNDGVAILGELVGGVFQLVLFKASC